MLAGIQALRDAGDTETFKGFDPDGPLASLMSDDADIAVEIDGTPWVAQKLDAMRAHATQITARRPVLRWRRGARRRTLGSRVLPPGRRRPTSCGRRLG